MPKLPDCQNDRQYFYKILRVDHVFLNKQGTENVWSGPLTNKAGDT
jgi:hypothetical protein